jgi:hypothetical protein
VAPPLLRKLIHLEKKALLDESDKLKVQEIKTAINNLPRPTKDFEMDKMMLLCGKLVDYELSGGQMDPDFSKSDLEEKGLNIVKEPFFQILLASPDSSFYVGLFKEVQKETEWYGFTQKRNSKTKNGVKTYTRRIICMNDGKNGVIPKKVFVDSGFKCFNAFQTNNMINAMKLEGWLQNYTISTLGLELPRVLHCVSGGGRVDKWVKGEDYIVGITYNLKGIEPFIINSNPTQ